MEPSINAQLAYAKKRLREAGIETWALEADLLMAAILGQSRSYIIGYPETSLSPEQLDRFQSFLKRRLQQEPLAYILGEKEFYGLSFKVTPDTLIPRPDTETLIEAVQHYFPEKDKPYTILDLGTGTGCLLITLLKLYPHSQGLGIDLNQRALNIAEENALQHQLESRSAWQQSSWCENLSGYYTIVVANPPYIPFDEKVNLARDVVGYEPHLALFAEDQGLAAYQAIATGIKPFLAPPNAMLFFEIGYGQEDAVISIFQSQGFTHKKSLPDLAGIVRCLVFSNQ